MKTEWQQIIKDNISEYLTTVDYSHPDFNLKQFKKQLGTIIGIEPGVQIKWNTVEKINELKRDAGADDYKEIIDKAEEIVVTFVDENDVNESSKLCTLKFLL